MHMHDQLWEQAATDFFKVGGGGGGGEAECVWLREIRLWVWAARREGGRCDMK